MKALVILLLLSILPRQAEAATITLSVTVINPTQADILVNDVPMVVTDSEVTAFRIATR